MKKLGVRSISWRALLQAGQAFVISFVILFAGTTCALADDCYRNWESARLHSESITKAQKQTATDLHGKAFAAHNQGNYEESERLWCSAVGEDPENAKYLFNLSCSRAKQGKIEGSLRFLSAALNTDPEKAWIWARNESDLAGLHSNSSYRSLMREYAPAPSSPEELIHILKQALEQSDAELFSRCLSADQELVMTAMDPAAGREISSRAKKSKVIEADLVQFRDTFYNLDAWKDLQAKYQENYGPFSENPPQGVNPDDFVVRFVTDYHKSMPPPGSGIGMVCESYSENVLYLRKTEKGWFLVAAKKSGNGGC